MGFFRTLNVIDTIFIVLALCFLFEQIFYWFLGTYPYRYGLVVKTISLSAFDINHWESMKGKISTLKIKTQFGKSEIYLRYKYPPLVLGPLLFIGQIKEIDSHGKLYIKIGPLSAIFVLFLLSYPFISSEFFANPMSQLLNIFILGVIIIYFYYRFLNLVKGII